MLYKKCKEKLNQVETSLKIGDLIIIRNELSIIDIDCQNLTLIEIESLWFDYSDEYCAQCLVVTDSTIEDFINWIL